MARKPLGQWLLEGSKVRPDRPGARPRAELTREERLADIRARARAEMFLAAQFARAFLLAAVGFGAIIAFPMPDINAGGGLFGAFFSAFFIGLVAGMLAGIAVPATYYWLAMRRAAAKDGIELRFLRSFKPLLRAERGRAIPYTRQEWRQKSAPHIGRILGPRRVKVFLSGVFASIILGVMFARTLASDWNFYLTTFGSAGGPVALGLVVAAGGFLLAMPFAMIRPFLHAQRMRVWREEEEALKAAEPRIVREE